MAQVVVFKSIATNFTSSQTQHVGAWSYVDDGAVLSSVVCMLGVPSCIWVWVAGQCLELPALVLQVVIQMSSSW